MKSWYAYLDGDPLNSDNYYLSTISPPFKGIGNKICAVYLKRSGLRPPQFSEKLKIKIANALISGEPQFSNQQLIVTLKK